MSDQLLLGFVDNPLTITRLETFKGWFFVAASAALLYGIIRIGLSDIRRAHAEVPLSEERLRRLTDNASDMIYRMTLPDGKYEYVSPASVDLFGYTPEVFYNSPLLIQKMIHSDWQGYFKEEWEKLLAGEMPPFYEYQVVDRSSATRWFNQRNTLVRDDLGKPVAIEGILTDITERKRIEEVLRQTVERLRFVIEGTETGLWDWDLATNRVSYSREWKQLLGYEEQEIADAVDECLRLTHPDDIEPVLAQVSAFLQQPVGTLATEFRMRHKSGQYRWILSHATAPLGDDGKPARLIGLHIDITERKQAEEKLSQSEELFSKAFLASPSGMTITRIADGKFINANESFLSMLEFSREETIGHTSTELKIWSPEEREKLMAQLLASGGLRNFELLARSKSGRFINLLCSSKQVEVDGEACHVTTFVDITARKQAEEELRKYRDHLEDLVKERTAELEEAQEALVSMVEDLNEKTVQLEQAMDKAQSADRLKSAFLAAMSHELRTPLNSIIRKLRGQIFILDICQAYLRYRGEWLFLNEKAKCQE